MTAFQVAGPTTVITGDGNVNTANLLIANTINPLTGARGPSTIRITNSSNVDVATMEWEPLNATYTFGNLTGNTGGSGANAVFTVDVMSIGYDATATNAGDSYAISDTITIDGTDVGGASPANDVTITVNTVSNTGAILTFTTTGTVNWPQTSGNTTVQVLPNTSDFVQINALNNVTDTWISGNCASGNMIITPVNLI